MNHGSEIIRLLEEQGITINEQIKNIINLISYEVYNKGIEEGIQEGKKIGINKACKEIEMRIALIRSKE